jgi:hypothetical protein
MLPKADDAGETPKPKDVALAGGVTYAAATRAVRRHQAGRIPAPYRAGVDARTVLGAHIMLGRAFADAVTWKYLSENPVTGAARIRQERKGHNVWTVDRLRPFLLTAKDERLYAELGRYLARLDDAIIGHRLVPLTTRST